jgi:hypothetical protein
VANSDLSKLSISFWTSSMRSRRMCRLVVFIALVLSPRLPP